MSVLLTIGLAQAAARYAYTPTPLLLFVMIGGLEVLRLGCMALLAKRYGRENLSAP